MSFNEDNFGTTEESRRANKVIQAINDLLETGVTTMPTIGAKISLECGSAIPPLAMLALSFGKTKPGDTAFARTEGVIFSAFYLICSIEDYGNGIICGFTPENVTKAKAMFQMVMGREYTDIHPILARMIEVREEKAKDVPNHVKGFMPH